MKTFNIPVFILLLAHHTNMDLYDKAIEADMKQNAVMTAVFTWLAANRDGFRGSSFWFLFHGSLRKLVSGLNF